MTQLSLMILIALLAGLFAAGCTWLSVDLGYLAARLIAARRARKRLKAEAAALKHVPEEAVE